MSEDYDFPSAGSGASQTVPVQCSALRKNGYVVIKDRPCKIVEMSTSKTGKHGSAKVHLVAMDIFTNKKYEDISPSTANMQQPLVTRREYQLVDVNDDFLELMNDAGDIKDDIRVPTGELGEDLKKKFENEETLMVQVLSAMGEEAVAAVRPVSDKK